MAKRNRQNRSKNVVSDEMLAKQIAHLDENAALVSVQLAEATAYVLRTHFDFTAEQTDQALKMILDRAKARRSLFQQQFKG